MARRLVLSAAAVLLCLGLVELTLHLLWRPASFIPRPGGQMLVDHATLFWRNQPGETIDPVRGVRYLINADGLRGAPLRQDDAQRILCLGESTTFGLFVEGEQAYPGILGERLRSRGPYEVLNAGGVGYTIWQSRVLLEELGPELRPSLVLVYHEANDHLPRGVSGAVDFQRSVRFTDRRLYELRRPVAPLLGLLYRSRIFMGLRHLLLAPPADGPLPMRDNESFAAQFGVRVPDEDRRQALSDMVQLCEDIGCRLVLLQPTYSAGIQPTPLLANFAAEHDLLHVDLPKMRVDAGLAADPPFLLDDHHPRPAGHRFIAEATLSVLDQAGYLEPR